LNLYKAILQPLTPALATTTAAAAAAAAAVGTSGLWLFILENPENAFSSQWTSWWAFKWEMFMRQNPDWRAQYAFSDDAKYDETLLLNPFIAKRMQCSNCSDHTS
jgi:hypothetical protein